MVAGRAEYGPPARPPGQEWLTERASASGRRNSRPATPTTRAGAVLACVHDGARRADDTEGVSCAVWPDRSPSEDAIPDPSAHAAPRLRLCVGQCRPRYAPTASLSRA